VSMREMVVQKLSHVGCTNVISRKRYIVIVLVNHSCYLSIHVHNIWVADINMHSQWHLTKIREIYLSNHFEKTFGQLLFHTLVVFLFSRYSSISIIFYQ